MKNKLFILLPLIFLNACNTNIPANPQNQVDSSATSGQTLAETIKNPGFELLIEQKKANGEIISIGSKGVINISIDGFQYPLNKLIQNQLKIEIPSLSPGKHELSLSLYLTEDIISVPLIIPDLNLKKIFVLLRFTLNEQTNKIERVEYGYDFDRNGSIDKDREWFISLDSQSYYVITTDGQKRKISSLLEDKDTLPMEQVPPGVVPNSSGSNEGQTDISQQTNLSAPPKPESSDQSLYPLPPGSDVPPVPVPDPGDGEKGEAYNIPSQFPTPIPQEP